jgi:hypothetical protein
LDPSKSSTVATVVKCVLKTKTIVKFVDLTEPTHHTVPVFQDTSNLKPTPSAQNVKFVDTDVSLVNLNTIVLNVLTAESTPQNVLAQPVCMTTEFPSTVNHAQENVILATRTPLETSSVTLALKEELTPQNVNVPTELGITTELVKFVVTHVTLVLTNIPVLTVLTSELTLQNVHAQPCTMN